MLAWAYGYSLSEGGSGGLLPPAFEFGFVVCSDAGAVG